MSPTTTKLRGSWLPATGAVTNANSSEQPGIFEALLPHEEFASPNQ